MVAGQAPSTDSVEDASWRTHSCVLHRHSCRCPPDAETSLGAARKSACATRRLHHLLVGQQAHGNSLTVAVRFVISSIFSLHFWSRLDTQTRAGRRVTRNDERETR